MIGPEGMYLPESIGVGYGPGGSGGSVAIPTSYDLSVAAAALPAAWTSSRSGTAGTYRNDNGKWVAAPINTLRYHNDPDTGLRGIILEETTVTNKNTNVNINPAATTNLTKGGDAASTLTIVDITADIATAGLDLLCTNGDVFYLNNASGVTDATCTIGGTTGNTNRHSLSLWAKGAGTGKHGHFGLTGGTTVDISGTTFQRYKNENITPGATTDQFVITVQAGKGVYFILNQLEENRIATTPIYTNGTTGVRNPDNVTALIGDIPVNPTNGGFAVRVHCPAMDSGQTSEGIIAINNGTGSASSFALRAIGNSRPMFEAQVINPSNTDQSNNDMDGVFPGRGYPVGMSWSASGAATLVSGSMRFTELTGLTMPAGITKARLGRSSDFNSQCVQILITHIFLFDGTPTLNDLALVMIPSGAIGVSAMGQSNMRVFGRDETSGSNKNLGAREVLETLQPFYPGAPLFWLDGSVTGTSLDDDPSGPSWMEINGGDFQDGLYLTNAKRQLNAFKAAGGTVVAHCWNQGENDQGGPTTSQWKERLKYVLDQLRTVETAPCILIPPANRTSVAAGYETWRKAFRELANENNYIFRGPESYWITMDSTSNNLHIASAGTVEYAPILGTAIAALNGKSTASPWRGPLITAASRSGSDVAVTILQDNGATDFTPVTAIQGFRFYDNTTEINITGAVRTNATTITLTLATTPVNGNDRLFYGQGTMSTVSDWTKVVRDNSTYALGLMTEEMTLPYTATIPKDFLGTDFNSSDFNT